jgi:NAD(P) transhydrogenase subunit alpha
MSQAFIDAEMALFRAQAREVDIVITTALIPGRPAPRLWTRDMVEAMRPGSVVVDLAASHGGNCELTQPGEEIVHGGVHVLGVRDLPCRMAPVASQLYARNLVHLLDDLSGHGARWRDGLTLDPQDEVVRGAVVLREGAAPSWPALQKVPDTAPAAKVPDTSPAREVPDNIASVEKKAGKSARAAAPGGGVGHGHGHGHGHGGAPGDGRVGVWVATGAALLLLAGAWLLRGQGGAAAAGAGQAFLQHLTVFVLACVVGWHVVWSVTPALHTPLMSVTNAISGIIVIGGLLQLGGDGGAVVRGLAIAAVALATINVAGGFLVTRRMLAMFRK